MTVNSRHFQKHYEMELTNNEYNRITLSVKGTLIHHSSQGKYVYVQVHTHLYNII